MIINLSFNKIFVTEVCVGVADGGCGSGSERATEGTGAKAESIKAIGNSNRSTLTDRDPLRVKQNIITCRAKDETKCSEFLRIR